MGVLAGLAVGALVLAGCYAPSIRDCTVSCASPSDCAAGQVCGADGMCVAPDRAGRCETIDAGERRDAALDADPARLDAGGDAATTAIVHVQVMGKGSIAVDGIAVCSTTGTQRGDCTYSVAIGAPLTVQAIEVQLDEVFQMWTSMTCSGQGRRCTFTPLAATTISARFGKSGMHVDTP